MDPISLLTLLFASSILVPVADRVGRSVGAFNAPGYLTTAALAAALLSSLMLTPGRYKPVSGSAIPVAELKVDYASQLFALLFISLGLLVSIYSLEYMKREEGLGAYYLLLLLMVAGMVGVALANDLFTLYCFWELMSISAYALVAFRREHWEPVEAGLKYLVMSTLGALMALYAVSLVYGIAGTTNFDDLRTMLSPLNTGGAWLRLLIALFLFGWGVTTAIAPFHTWLPDAHPAAPSSISAMLSGVLIKAGVYAIARTIFYTLPLASGVSYVLMLVGVATSTIGNLSALRQADVKRFLAYSSIANIGYIVIGLGASYRAHVLGLENAALVAMGGALLHVINHALGKGLLFLCAGSLIHVVKSRAISKLEGLGRLMPVTGFSSAIGLLNLAGIPPLSGFWSKLLIAYGLTAMIEEPPVAIVLLLFVVNAVIAAGYYVYFTTRLFRERGVVAREVPPLMWIPELALAGACIVLTLLLTPVLELVYEGASSLMG